MPKLYLVCGIPASGKTSIATKIAGDENAVYISSDAIRRKLFGDVYDPEQNRETFQEFYYSLTDAFYADRDIVLESIFRRMSERKKIAVRAKKRGYTTVCIYCQKHFAYAIRANKMRPGTPREIPGPVFLYNYNHFSEPTKAEGWDEICVMDGDKYSVEVEGQKPIKYHWWYE